MRKNKKKNIFLLLFVLLCSLGIGYAFLRTELTINGTADFLDARWDIHFASLVVNPNSVELSTGNTGAAISSSTTEVTYAVTLKEPGDFYEFTVDAVNAGTIDGMIDTISSKMGGVEITTLPDYMEYSITYSDGIELAPNQYLKAGETETYKVHIGFKKDINASDLTGQVENKTLSFSVTYVQADENAVERPVPTFADSDWDTIINTIKSKNSCGPYNVGDSKEIDMGTFGTHTLRIANCTKPAECSNEGFSESACGVVLEFTDIITTHWMNSTITSLGGWASSEMRSYLNTNVYNELPNNIRNSIIDSYIISSYYSPDTDNFYTTDKLYLLSSIDVWGIHPSDTTKDFSRQLDYYNSLGLNDSTNNNVAIKKYNGEGVYWWLRSVRGSDMFLCVTNIGSKDNVFGNYYNSTNQRGVSPAFRIA